MSDLKVRLMAQPTITIGQLATQGPQGIQGPPGPQGIPGPVGPPGPSAPGQWQPGEMVGVGYIRRPNNVPATDILLICLTAGITGPSEPVWPDVGFTQEDGTAVWEIHSRQTNDLFRFKGTVATQADLPDASNIVGDVWEVQDEQTLYAWTGDKWSSLGVAGGDGESGGVQVGSIFMYAGDTAPPGALFCTGASLLRSAYPDLFTAIGTTYGAVDDDHFNIPDFRGRFARMLDMGKGLDPDRTLGSTQGDAIRNITGEITPIYGDNANSSSWTPVAQGSGAFRTRGAVSTSSIAKTGAFVTIGAGIDLDTSRVVPTADENRPVNMAVMFCIQAFGSTVNPGLADITQVANDIAGLEVNKLDKQGIILDPDTDLNTVTAPGFYTGMISINTNVNQPGGATETLTSIYFTLRVYPTDGENRIKQDFASNTVGTQGKYGYPSRWQRRYLPTATPSWTPWTMFAGGGAGMPSTRYVDLALPASGGTVTMPGNGWLVFSKIAASVGENIHLFNQTSSLQILTAAPVPINLLLYMPVVKNDAVLAGYTASGGLIIFRFVYAEGGVV